MVFYKQTVTAEVCTLSACQTAMGKLKSLARLFEASDLEHKVTMGELKYVALTAGVDLHVGSVQKRSGHYLLDLVAGAERWEKNGVPIKIVCL